MKKVLGTILNVFTDLLLIVALVVLVLSGYTAYQYKSDPANAYLFGYKPILVLTGSMEPTMKVNSICIAEKTEYDDVKLNDIIMYEIDDKLITHRVIDITDEGIRTKGDNNNAEDAYYITKDHLRAKVIYIANWTAPIINDLQTRDGILKWVVFPIFVIVVITVLIAVIKRILRAPDKEDEDPDVEEKTEQKPSEEIVDNKKEIDTDSPPQIIQEEPVENTTGKVE